MKYGLVLWITLSIFFIFVFAVSGCFPIFAFTSLVDVPVAIASSTVGLKIFTITAGIKKCESIVKKKKHDHIVLLTKTKLIIIKVLLTKS